jgi:predicted RNase H-like nuclease
MLFSHAAYIGIILGSGRALFTLAALDAECNLLNLLHGRLDDALTLLNSYPSVIAALDAPSTLARPASRKRPADEVRAAERELRERGILAARAALKPDSPRGKHGRALYDGLRKAGFILHPDDGATHLWFESNPHACFTVLLGHNPMPRQSLEGRLQRQIILYDAGVNVSEPMDFFDELTRHNLKMGQLPLDQIHTPDELDALVLAYTAWMVLKHPAETNSVGTEEEGIVVLPVGELKEKY